MRGQEFEWNQHVLECGEGGDQLKTLKHEADGIGPKRGARVVAKAWTDPDYKHRGQEVQAETLVAVNLQPHEDPQPVEEL